MKTFRLARGLFHDVIAAPSCEAAQELARIERGRDGPMVELLTPDTWTRRAAEAALALSIIDTMPRWFVEGPDGREQELDLDDLPRTTEAQRVELRRDSPIHAAWLDAILATEAGGDALRKLVVDVATERNPEAHARKARVLAAAYGLGPVPLWHAAILPALVALDAQLEHEGRSMGLDALELPIERLADRMSYVLDLRLAYTTRRIAMRLRDALDAHLSTSLRDASEWILLQLQVIGAA